ncbi:beta-N-acetylhexosaminidase [Streptomyces marispadix]|uniref:beta-N-acetylhexosaminidase n=1 Tax=Streptomyces marispadix TaxID=2922868 RepID=A0ABS9SWD2_9ACTN|nr:beta-N-acetylhexosaminidase [Streptomyces marispadix]MCH6160555.1 beta-N-acetylhexosaminidase [Streptomyces marispadix]
MRVPYEPHRSLVPAPRSVTAGPQQGRDAGDFVVGPDTALDAGPGTSATACWLRACLTPAMGLPLLPPHGGHADPGRDPGRTVLVLRTDETVAARLGPEGYELRAGQGTLRITGGDPAGVFWGTQTLRQLLGPAAYRRARTTARETWTVPAVHIEDAPRFAWRGHLLDVARHFMPKDGVLRTVDLLAAHKLNVLHLHLTDDQGWRVEIRRHPRLTGVGATRARTRVGHRGGPGTGGVDGGGPDAPLWDERAHGGFYTQDDLREIVAYAAERHITVVPEIDIPGHSQAAIAAYPELGNTDVVDTGSLDVWTDWGVSPNVLAAGDHVLRFYEGVLEEVLEIFPSRFVHLGGDECPKDQWRASAAAQARIRELGLDGEDGLQAWFTRHFDRWLTARGRRLIGWDEILEGGLAEGAAVSSWRGRSGGIAAARAGHDVVMCPEDQVYLDHRQHGGSGEPVPVGRVRTLRDVYEFEPVPPELAGTSQERHVLGAQANMWTECTEDQRRVDYQTFPRLAAFAETVWSPRPGPGGRDFEDFRRRMTDAHYARLDALGVAYRPPGGPRPWQRRPGIPGRPLDGPEPELGEREPEGGPS